MTAPRPDGMVVELAAVLVRERTGLVFPAGRRESLVTYLADDMRRRRVRSPQRYLERLAAERPLFDALVAAMTVGETYFHRDPQQLAVLGGELLPALVRARPAGHRLRLWSAGCSTGEEAYTLAMIARDGGFEPMPSILGTDISRTSLARAVRGRYGRWCFRGVDDAIRDRNFAAAENEWIIAPALREPVSFGYLNLAEDAYPSLASGIWGMDLIVCRNVLIYFDRETAARVQRRLIASLAEGGYLVLGAADPMISESDDCEALVTTAGVVYQRRPAGERSVERAGERAGERAAAKAGAPPPVAPPVAPPAVRDWEDAESVAPASSVRQPHRAQPGERPAPAPRRDARATSGALEAAYAERDYALVARLAPLVGGSDAARAATLRIRALANLGDLAAAGRCCADAVERFRDRAELLYLHAVLLAEAGRHDESARAARSALYLDRGLIVAHLAAGAARTKLGERARARAAFRRAAHLLAALGPREIVPASDGEPAAALTEMVKVRLAALEDVA